MNIDDFCTSKNIASCIKGFLYQGCFKDFILLLRCKFAVLLVIPEYTEGGPVVGVFLP